MDQIEKKNKIDKLKRYQFIEDQIGSLKHECRSVARMIECLERFHIHVKPETYDELRNTIRENEVEIERLEAEEKTIIDAIEAISSKREMAILKSRYVNCMEWSTIASKYKYSRMQVSRIHISALEKISL